MPDADVNLHVPLEEWSAQTFRVRGPAPSLSKTDSRVRYIHLPTGVSAECTVASQHKNDGIARRMLRAKLYRLRERRGGLTKNSGTTTEAR